MANSKLVVDVAEHIGLSVFEVLKIAQTAPRRYKTYYIPKRSGGQRQIAQPAREVKRIQYVLAENLLNKFSIHPAACAYRIGKNIADNAQQHLASKAILKLDFRDFFHSILETDWEKFCAVNAPDLTPDDIEFSKKIFFWERDPRIPRCLSIGAPTSPIISNILMFNIDTAIAAKAESLNIPYTRYADDITFSADDFGKLLEIRRETQAILSAIGWPKLSFNDAKTIIVSKKYRRTVTGVVLSSEGKVSLGRARKRQIAAKIHKAKLGLLEPDEMLSLKGLLAFALSIEPVFVARMTKKYGTASIELIKRFQAPRRVEIDLF